VEILWLYNNTNTYGSNFSLYQGSSGNTALNSSSGQEMEFKINKKKLYANIFKWGCECR
jgi:hypothetical protein